MLYNRLSYLLILSSTLLFFICFDGYISYYVFVLSLALPVFSLLISLPGMLTMRVRVFLQDEESLARTRKGTSVPLRVEARTRWPLPSGPMRLRLTVRNTLTGTSRQEWLLLTLGEKPLLLEHALQSAACGLVTCTVTKVRACDLLGLFALPVRLRGQNYCSAFFYPAVYSPSLAVQPRYDPDSDSDRYSQTKPGGDLTELFGLRDYRPGDKLSRIHWKLSQKTGRTLVKEPSLPLADCILFFLDLNGQGPEADVLLDVFATISGFLLQREAAHRVVYCGDGRTLSQCELAVPEDMRPALEALLSAGGKAALPPIREEELPRGVSHVIYLCRTPSFPVVDRLRRHYASARFTGFCTGEQKLPDPDFIPVLPGQVTETLNGMVF